MYRILLVDDEIISIEALKRIINTEALSIDEMECAYDAEEARALLESDSFDIMICDIEMPGETGLDLMNWIAGKNLNMVCIFLTCHPEFNYAKQAIALGVFEYLVKPISRQELNEALERAIDRRKQLMENERARSIASSLSQEIQTENEPENQADQVIEEVRRYIIDNIGNEELDVKSIADHVYLNKDYLSRLFKAKYDTSIKNYIISSRITLASELLVNSTLSVSKIAMSCGYSHMAHFSKMFKMATGLRPNEYRAKYKK